MTGGNRVTLRKSSELSMPRICTLIVCLALLRAGMQAQAILTTIPNVSFYAMAVNPATNTIYASGSAAHPQLNAINGATNAVTTIQSVYGDQVLVNPNTNTIYVIDPGNYTFCLFGCKGETDPGHIFVVDGATNVVTTLAYDPNIAIYPVFGAVNPETNKLYVANYLSSNITIVDGATNTMTTVTDPTAWGPVAVAVNPATNKIYVANQNGDTITVLDGATNAITMLQDANAILPTALAVNPVTNKIYVANLGDDGQGNSNYGNISVIDGSDNSITTVTDPNALAPGGPGCIESTRCQNQPIAINTVTNKIYVANYGTRNGSTYNVTVIDGVTNSTTTITDPNAYQPIWTAVDSATNKIYVLNWGPALIGAYPYTPGSLTVIDGATNAVSTVITPSSAAISFALDETNDRVYVNDDANLNVIGGSATPVSHVLGVVFQGAGSGTVTINPSGINCTTDCAATFPPGAAANLAAVPSPNSAFVGWTMSCSGQAPCNLNMNSDQYVGANFVAQDFSLQAGSTDLSVMPGGQATDILTITPLNVLPFNGTIALACNMLTGNFGDTIPAPACSFSPASVSPGSNTVTTTMTITAQSSTKAAAAGILRNSRALPALWLTPLFGCILLAGLRRPGRTRWMQYGGLMGLLILQAACANAGSSGPPLAPQNFTAYVTATSGATQHVVQISVTVQ